MSLKLIENYFQQLQSLEPYEAIFSRPIYSIELDIIEKMVDADSLMKTEKRFSSKELEDLKDEIQTIRNRTDEKISVPLSVVEFMISATLMNKEGRIMYNKELSMRDNNNQPIEMPLFKWVWYIKSKALPRMKSIANEIASKYNLEVQYRGSGDGIKLI